MAYNESEYKSQTQPQQLSSAFSDGKISSVQFSHSGHKIRLALECQLSFMSLKHT